jgi:hypothetical protein
MNEIIDLSKENKEPKEYKCIRKTIEFKVKDDGKSIELYGAKIINAKEGVIRL